MIVLSDSFCHPTLALQTNMRLNTLEVDVTRLRIDYGFGKQFHRRTYAIVFVRSRGDAGMKAVYEGGRSPAESGSAVEFLIILTR